MNAIPAQNWADLVEPLRRYIRRRVAQEADADDLLQEVFLKAQRSLDQLDDPTRLPGWLFRIARNAIVNHYRRARPTVELPETLAAEQEPDEAGELAGLTAAFRRMVHNLPPHYREAILLAEFEGLPQAQLAARTGLSLSGAKSRVQRGRALLREMLDACCTFEQDRRGRVIDCTPRTPSGCTECGTL